MSSSVFTGSRLHLLLAYIRLTALNSLSEATELGGVLNSSKDLFPDIM